MINDEWEREVYLALTSEKIVNLYTWFIIKVWNILSKNLHTDFIKIITMIK